jgi:signal transduction histidine kinase
VTKDLTSDALPSSLPDRARSGVLLRAEPLSPAEAEQLGSEAVRAFSARLAHQLGNLLQVVNGNLELIAARTTDEAVLRYIANASTAAEQLTALARSLPVDPPE